MSALAAAPAPSGNARVVWSRFLEAAASWRLLFLLTASPRRQVVAVSLALVGLGQVALFVVGRRSAVAEVLRMDRFGALPAPPARMPTAATDSSSLCCSAS